MSNTATTHPDVPVPATRSASYLRTAVAEIDPDLVAEFDQELQAASIHTDIHTQLAAYREHTHRWLLYIALYGDPVNRQLLHQATGAEDGEALFELHRQVNRSLFPDAEDEPEDLGVRVFNHRGRWRAVCPVTLLRTDHPTEQGARDALQAALMALHTGA